MPSHLLPLYFLLCLEDKAPEASSSPRRACVSVGLGVNTYLIALLCVVVGNGCDHAFYS